SIINFEKL
nr:Chain P, Ovalbumin peptide1P4L_P Chain P, Ovalbumin peptide [synthetic construct]1VAC_P Chain P, CHICKEN OVALBUMIN [Gallus gallus]3C8K_P Chain P, Ovalbumin peptide [synthetic construct]3CVH_C Chain C, Ovalbumin [Gallus gallus]3CVH_O Chain O, Ovalbumin [Gallus gallus]3P9L_C Chain C, Ovalbumin epitope, SIINFEKL [synthetic construct]3P9L_F Chain F, Ovalbumin epitope, SIINFEKL [synthetic construct]4HKJ_C Chain C, Ovalbumin [Gallus gallus]4HKJ_G Chain G, Ovalbumin [Gallus gallus]4HKJ_K Chai